MKKPFLLFVCVSLILNSQFSILNSLAAQDTTYARRVIRQLSSPTMKGRGASHKGDSLAAAFLATEMRNIGLQPLAPDYLQHYTYPCYSFTGPVRLSINGKELIPYSQFRICPSSRYATPEKLKKARWSQQQDDGTWILSVDKLDTYGPITGPLRPNPVCIEVLDSLIPRRVRKVEYQIPLQHHPAYRSQNVVGYLPGEVDTMMVFTAHYDHCGTMGDGVLFPGAHDNASGVAAVLDIARQFSKSQNHYTLVFMLFSGEESGLLGSSYAADHPLINFSKVRLLCNIDMFCGGDEGLMVFNADAKETKPYYNRMKALNDSLQVAPEVRPRKNSPNSDHYPFTKLCPAIFVLTMGGPYGGYHDPADTCHKCGLSNYNNNLTLLLQALGLN